MKQILCLSYAPWRARGARAQQLLARMADAQILFFEPAPSKGAPTPKQGRRVRSHITVYTLPAPLPGPAGRRGERASGCGAALARGCAAWLRRDR